MTNMRPCPFCGHEAAIGIGAYWADAEKGLGGNHQVGCDNEKCPVRPSVIAATRRTAIRKWNTRTLADQPNP